MFRQPEMLPIPTLTPRPFPMHLVRPVRCRFQAQLPKAASFRILGKVHSPSCASWQYSTPLLTATKLTRTESRSRHPTAFSCPSSTNEVSPSTTLLPDTSGPRHTICAASSTRDPLARLHASSEPSVNVQSGVQALRQATFPRDACLPTATEKSTPHTNDAVPGSSVLSFAEAPATTFILTDPAQGQFGRHLPRLPGTSDNPSNGEWLLGPHIHLSFSQRYEEARQTLSHTNESFAWPRYNVLLNAIRCNDIFFVLINQLFCAWSLNPAVALHILTIEASVVDTAFHILGEFIRPNTGMQLDDLRWFASFPFWRVSQMAQDPRAGVFLFRIRLFLQLLAEQWKRLLSPQIPRRQYPILSDELRLQLRLESQVLERVVFTYTRRMLGIQDGETALRAEELFLKDCANMDTLPSQQERGRFTTILVHQYVHLLQQYKSGIGYHPVDSLEYPGQSQLHSSPGMLPASNQTTASMQSQLQQQRQQQQHAHQPVNASSLRMSGPHPFLQGQQGSVQPDITPAPVARTSQLSHAQVTACAGPSTPGPSSATGCRESPRAQQIACFAPGAAAYRPSRSSITVMPPLPSQVQKHSQPVSNPSVDPRSHGSPGHQQPDSVGFRAFRSLPNGQQGSIEGRRAVLTSHTLPRTSLDSVNGSFSSGRLDEVGGPGDTHTSSGSSRSWQHPGAHALPRMNNSNRPQASNSLPLNLNTYHPAPTGAHVSSQSAILSGRSSSMRPISPGSTLNRDSPQRPIAALLPAPKASAPTLDRYARTPYNEYSAAVSLHQALVRSPRLVPAQLPNSEMRIEKQPYFQAVKCLASGPLIIEPGPSTIQLFFEISETDFSKVPRAFVPKGESVLAREYFSSAIRYRFRICTFPAVNSNPTSVPESDWVVKPTVWPTNLFASINGKGVTIRRKLHYGQDQPVELTPFVTAGLNTVILSLTGQDTSPSSNRYVAAIEIVETTSLKEVTRMVEQSGGLSEESTMRTIKNRLQPDDAQNADDVAITDSTLSIDLADPFTAIMFEIPVRGAYCTHLECFDLLTWLDTRPRKPMCQHRQLVDHMCESCQRMAALGPEPSMVDKWKCPLCGKDARPYSLRIDKYLQAVRVKLASQGDLEAKRLIVDADGNWIARATRQDATSREDGKAAEAGSPRTGPPAKRVKSDDTKIRLTTDVIELD